MDDIQKADNLVELRLEVGLLKRDVSYMTTLFDKMDKLIEKIKDQQDNIINKTSLIIETKDQRTKEEFDDLYDTLEKLETTLSDRICTIENLLHGELKEMNKTLKDHIEEESGISKKFNQLKYTGSGVIIILLWALNNIDTLKAILK